MTDPAWAARGSWFPFVFNRRLRRAAPLWEKVLATLDNRGEMSTYPLWMDSPGRHAEGWLLQPARLSAATACGLPAPTLPRTSWVRFQRCWLHGWSMCMDISCPCRPALLGTSVLGCEGSPSSSHSPAASSLGEAENPRKHGIIRKSNYLIIKRLNYSASYCLPSARLGELFPSIDTAKENTWRSVLDKTDIQILGRLRYF